MLLKFNSNYKRFIKDTKGQIAIMFAMLLVPLAVVIGAGIDWSQQVTTTTKLQSSVDSAILAVARAVSVDASLSQGDQRAIAEKIFDANLHVSKSVELDDFLLVTVNKKITLTYTGEVETYFLKLIDIPTLDLNVIAEVDLKFSSIDLALAVDLSGSMYGTKISELIKATKILLDELALANVENMRVSFIPWTRGVNLGKYENAVTVPSKKWYNTPNYSNVWASKKYWERYKLNHIGCVDSRSSGKMKTTGTTRNHNYEHYCPFAKLIPLTNLKGDGKADLIAISKTWKARGGTGSNHGMYWAYATLHNKFDSIFGVPALPDPTTVKKYAIIMTDGENNKTIFDKKMLVTCTQMKEAGIIIYTIVLKVKKASVLKTFKACASPNSGGVNYFITADTGAELKVVFKRIATEVGQFSLTK